VPGAAEGCSHKNRKAKGIGLLERVEQRPGGQAEVEALSLEEPEESEPEEPDDPPDLVPPLE
jgi:hypothetical protein